MEIKDLFREVKYPIRIFDKNGNQIYYQEDDCWWVKEEYNEKGNVIYREDSSKVWVKYDYDEKTNFQYIISSTGYWRKEQFDEKGNVIYQETSTSGVLIDNRPNTYNIYNNNQSFVVGEYHFNLKDNKTLTLKIDNDGTFRSLEIKDL
jgi:hypothetical protein